MTETSARSRFLLEPPINSLDFDTILRLTATIYHLLEQLTIYNMLTGVNQLTQEGQQTSLYSIQPRDDEWHRITKFGLNITDATNLANAIEAIEEHLRSQRNVIVLDMILYRRNNNRTTHSTLRRHHPPWFDGELRQILTREEAALRRKKNPTPDSQSDFSENDASSKQCQTRNHWVFRAVGE